MTTKMADGVCLQSHNVPTSVISTGQLYYVRDSSGTDQPPVGLDPVPTIVPVVNGRSGQHTLDKNGFVFLNHPYNHIDYLDDNAIVTTYYQEVCDLVRIATGATEAYAFDHNVRSSGKHSWMNQEAKEGDTHVSKLKHGNLVQSPARVVHGDYTITSAPNRLKMLSQPPKVNDTWGKTHGDRPLIDPSTLEEAIATSRRYIFVNVWRNIVDEPVQDMPLGMCDAESISKEDLVTFEVRYPDRTGENYFARHSLNHKWAYYPLMTKDEAILLKCWDSHGKLAQSLHTRTEESHGTDNGTRELERPADFSLHSAFKDPSAPSDCPKRLSIEVRTVAFY
jgi:hypothetical protein